MNTLDKVTNIKRDIRELNYTLKAVTAKTSVIGRDNEKLKEKVSALEELLVSKLQVIFDSEDSPLYDIEQRIKVLEKKE